MISLIVFLVVLGVVWYFVDRLPMQPTIKTIVTLLFVLVALFAVLGAFGIGPGFGFPRLNG